MLFSFLIFSLCVATSAKNESKERRVLIFIVATAVLLAIFVGGYFWIENGKKQEAVAQKNAAAAKKQDLFNQKLEEIKNVQNNDDIKNINQKMLEALKMCALNIFFEFRQFDSYDSYATEVTKEKTINSLKILYDKTSFIDENGKEKEWKDINKEGGIFIFIANDGNCYVENVPKDLDALNTEKYVSTTYKKTFYHNFFAYNNNAPNIIYFFIETN